MDQNVAWKLFEMTGSVKDYIAYKAASDRDSAAGEKVLSDAYQNNGDHPLQKDDGRERFHRHHAHG